MLLDTTFLIDLQREAIQNEVGPAFQFLETQPEAPVRISVVTAGEFAEGFPPEKRSLCSELLQPYEVVEISLEVAWEYAHMSRELRQAGVRMGDNDLWIAATALQKSLPLVTRDGSHFRRIQNLQVLEY